MRRSPIRLRYKIGMDGIIRNKFGINIGHVQFGNYVTLKHMPIGQRLCQILHLNYIVHFEWEDVE